MEPTKTEITDGGSGSY